MRTYDYSDSYIKLERKDKFGILTQKQDVRIAREQIPALEMPCADLFDREGEALVAQMRAAALRPAVIVRYRRDAFYHAGSDFRLTFDLELEAAMPEIAALFDPAYKGVPVLDGNSVIMEIKYGDRIPSFARKLTNVNCKQLSVSKYALCREIFL